MGVWKMFKNIFFGWFYVNRNDNKHLLDRCTQVMCVNRRDYKLKFYVNINNNKQK